jgi:hypothetical protein
MPAIVNLLYKRPYRGNPIFLINARSHEPEALQQDVSPETKPEVHLCELRRYQDVIRPIITGFCSLFGHGPRFQE